MHIDFALPVDGSLNAGLDEWLRKGQQGCMDYGFHMGVTSWSDSIAAQMAEVVARGVNSFKFFMAYKARTMRMQCCRTGADLKHTAGICCPWRACAGLLRVCSASKQLGPVKARGTVTAMSGQLCLQGALMVDDDQMIAGFRRCRDLGALAMVHAENGDAVAEAQRFVVEELGITGPEGQVLSRPAFLEAEATGRAVRLAQFAGVPLYVVHVMSEGAMNEVRRAAGAGSLWISACPRALALTWSSACSST